MSKNEQGSDSGSAGVSGAQERDRLAWSLLKPSRRLWQAFGAFMLGIAVCVVGYNVLPGQRYLDATVQPSFAADDPQFARSMQGVLGTSVETGTAISTLVNGDEIFPAMLGAIEDARESVNFETYIYWEGEVALRFARTLAQKARDGVAVRVILDAVGAGKMDDALLDMMEAAGVDLALFRPIAWYSVDRWNHRTHRKILVTDGRVGFTGGVGIAEEWDGDARNPGEWRDNHYRIVGPAVAGLQSAFAENWLEATGDVLQGDMFFPALAVEGDLTTQSMMSSARSGAANMHLAILMALAAATDHVRIAMAYFVPNEIAVAQLVGLRERGVEVEIILPGEHHDIAMVRGASRHLWGPLLEAGVRIYEYDATMYHTKLMVVDEAFATVGSVNFDERSFRLNDELNVNVYDAGFARTQIDLFEADKAISREVTLQSWRDRPALLKASDRFWSLFRSQM